MRLSQYEIESKNVEEERQEEGNKRERNVCVCTYTGGNKSAETCIINHLLLSSGSQLLLENIYIYVYIYIYIHIHTYSRNVPHCTLITFAQVHWYDGLVANTISFFFLLAVLYARTLYKNILLKTEPYIIRLCHSHYYSRYISASP